MNCVLLKRAVFAVALCLAKPVQADVIYVLQPGSTITPTDRPSEPLTGTFTWHLLGPSPNNSVGFNATSLAFVSPSFLLTLDATPANNYGSTLFRDTHTSYFIEIVDWDGLPGVPLEIHPTRIGTYEGPMESPTLLRYPWLTLYPRDGGAALATISFEAVQVPEPTTAELSLIGFASVVGRKLRLPNSKRCALRQ